MSGWPGRVAGVMLVAVLATGCGSDGSPEPSATPAAGSWTSLPAPPGPPRSDAVTAWTGREALFLGGDPNPPCPAGASCAAGDPWLRDGAAFDPAAGTWRRTAEAPAPIAAYSPSAVVGDRVYLFAGGKFVAYDASDDAWTTPPAPPESAGGRYPLVFAYGDRVALVDSSHERTDPRPDRVYDPTVRKWSLLPEDPLVPAFDRRAVHTSAGFVLLGRSLDTATGPHPVRAALLGPDGSWKLLPDSDIDGGPEFVWTGEHVLEPSLERALRSAPGATFGGRLDPAAGVWSPLPGAPAYGAGGWAVTALTGPFVASEGWLYDDRAETWRLLPRPAGAPDLPGAAVWAGTRLVVRDGASAERQELSPGAWTFEPTA